MRWICFLLLAVTGCDEALPRARAPRFNEVTSLPPERESLRELDCRQGKPVACAILATAYETGNSPLAPEIGRNLSRAAEFHGRSCDLGVTSNCYKAGELYEQAETKDEGKAIRFHRLGCKATGDSMAGFSCNHLGALLLNAHFFANYEEAKLALKSGCDLQNSTCDLYQQLFGTSRLSSSPTPNGAGGFYFGMPHREQLVTCVDVGGMPIGDRKKITCHDATIPMVSEHPMTVVLTACRATETLCQVGMFFNFPKDRVSAQFHAMRMKLSKKYGDPTYGEHEFPEECKSRPVLACRADARERESRSWIWADETRLVLIAGEGAAVGLVYSSPTWLKEGRARALGL